MSEERESFEDPIKENESRRYLTRIVWNIPQMFLPILSRPVPRVFSLPLVLPDSYAEWGGPSDFTLDNQEFDETSRKVEIVRVTDANDPENFVDVERVVEASFQNPERGNRMKLRMP